MDKFRTLDRVDVKGKRVLVRVDLNVPVENGVVTDSTRIARAAPAIVEIADKGFCILRCGPNVKVADRIIGNLESTVAI